MKIVYSDPNLYIYNGLFLKLSSKYFIFANNYSISFLNYEKKDNSIIKTKKIDFEEDNISLLMKINSTLIAIGQSDGCILIFDHNNNTLKLEVKAHCSIINTMIMINFENDFATIASGGGDTEVKITRINIKQSNLVSTNAYKCHLKSIFMLKKISNDLIISCSYNGALIAFNHKTNQISYKLENIFNIDSDIFNQLNQRYFYFELDGIQIFDVKNLS